MTGETIVVKLSGKALGATEELRALFTAARGKRLVVVHGGGVEVDALFEALRLEVIRKDGLRVSPNAQMPYISAALGGMCNKTLQAQALACGLKALGMLASDGGTVTVSQVSEALGMVGRAEPADGSYLTMLLDHGFTPVIASLAHDSHGELYNVNADDAALAVAAVLQAPLYYISDVPGVLDREGKLIDRLDAAGAEALIADGTVKGGMTVKVRSALEAVRRIGRPVFIASYRDKDLARNLFSLGRLGTAFLPE